MSLTGTAATGSRALHGRLLAVAPILLPGTDISESGASEMLDAMVGALLEDLRIDHLWLLFVAVSARYPTRDELLDCQRTFEVDGRFEATLWLLDTALEGALGSSAPRRDMVLLRNTVLVEVDHTAKHSLHTGVQQVVREVMPRWTRDHHVVPVAWTSNWGVHRALSRRELQRVVSWGRGDAAGPSDDGADSGAIVVPWQCVVVLAEVPFGNAPLRLSPLAQSSGNRVVAIGYDCIPVVSADLVPTLDSSRFVEYLSVIKHANAVAGISESAAAEFQGFVEALPSQGLKGPAVFECMLPAASGAATAPSDRDRTKRPMVLMVGSFEPRKNHLGVLHAAETLWREGLDFELTFIGGSGWGSEIPDRIAALTQFGRPITVLRNVDQARLDQAYRSARFTVFPSRHEGYGLPVAESLEAGTPVITSDFGSLRELASGGGALMVDPHDDNALANAMRRLLSDDAELALLRRQIAERPPRTWDDYARELWNRLVAPLLLPER